MQNNIDKFSGIATLNPSGSIYVLSRKVCCEGPEESKHPKVFLQIPQRNTKEVSISCPYCKQNFTYKNKNGKKSIH